MNGRMTDHMRRRRAGLSKAMKRHAEAARCPSCNRKSALRTLDVSGVGDLIFICRYCDETGTSREEKPNV